MSDEKHANDDYINPTSATSAQPVPSETFPAAEEPEDAPRKSSRAKSE